MLIDDRDQPAKTGLFIRQLAKGDWNCVDFVWSSCFFFFFAFWLLAEAKVGGVLIFFFFFREVGCLVVEKKKKWLLVLDLVEVATGS